VSHIRIKIGRPAEKKVRLCNLAAGTPGLSKCDATAQAGQGLGASGAHGRRARPHLQAHR